MSIGVKLGAFDIRLESSRQRVRAKNLNVKNYGSYGQTIVMTYEARVIFVFIGEITTEKLNS